MASTHPGSLTAPITIGRDAERAVLDDIVAGISASRGTTVRIVGEAGIGKSRLTRDLIAQFASTGRVVCGYCFETDRRVPFAPFVDLIRHELRHKPPEDVRGLLGQAGGELVRLLPELSTVFPDLAPASLTDTEPEKRRVIVAIQQVLEILRADQPLLIVIEDLHWADDISLGLIQHLARMTLREPVVLALTIRSDDTHPAIEHLMASLDRERLGVEIRLDPLSEHEVDLMLRAIFQQDLPIRPDFRTMIASLTDGNPFFIEEILRSLVASGDIYQKEGVWTRKDLVDIQIPVSVQDAVRARVERLDASATRVLEYAAVVGQRFRFPTLQQLTGLDERRLLEVLKQLIARQLIEERSADEFAFRHALTRQAIYHGLLARERHALHRNIVTLLEQDSGQGGDTLLNELAYHTFEAGLWDKAFAYTLRAGERAQHLYAPAAAVEHLNRSLFAAQQLGSVDITRVLHLRGKALELIGEIDRAEADYRQAGEHAVRRGDRTTQWQILLDTGLLWAARDYEQTSDYYEQALALAREIDDPLLIAHSLNWLGNLYANIERPREAPALHHEALRIFAEHDDERGIAQSHDLLAMSWEHCGEFPASARAADEAIAIYRDLGDRRGLASCLTTLSGERAPFVIHDVPSGQEDVNAALAAAEEARTISQDIAWTAGESYAVICIALCLHARGETRRALAESRTAYSIAESIQHEQWMTIALATDGLIHLDLLAYAAARDIFERSLRRVGRVRSIVSERIIRTNLARALIALGEHDRARCVIDEGLAGATTPATMGERLLWQVQIEAALAAGRTDDAIRYSSDLLASCTTYDPLTVPRIAYLHGRVLAATGEGNEAERTLRAAARGAAAQQRRPLLWWIYLELGRLYETFGRTDEARLALDAAVGVIDTLAADAPMDLADAFRAQALAYLPAPTQQRRPQRDRLTAREREVANRIALGRTNREIAAELFVGTRTVETHVTNILNKLGFTSRAQIAVWVVEQSFVGTAVDTQV